ncbi:hypothetical protein [Microvirga pudoricolor]|uniref:hypothetical protein n=1 Tax=Microvirga pudoricolor TaxID=2778729 RepID=UPI00194E5074|nr:hypothetical protein [Microvirga pudoricolor]MBM6593858.1 hypothetical protein [Microvirga pudoricolor]
MASKRFETPSMEVLTMRRFTMITLAALGTLTAFSGFAEAQAQSERPLTLRVTPRSFLDPGPVAPVGSMNRYATTGQSSLVTSPPWSNNERFSPNLPSGPGEPFVGARNPFDGIETTGSIR